MASPASDPARIARDASWLAHRYDPITDAVHFVHAPRDAHRNAMFLTDEYLPGSARPVPVPRGAALDAAPATGAIHFIFHSAFCCSTLLARAFDIEGVSMGLKEPPILQDLVGWRHRGGDAPEIARALDAALTLLARPFGEGEAVVVKPSNVVNAFAPAILAMRPAARAVLLHAPLRVFVMSVAKKGMAGRLWVRDLLTKQRRDGLADFGYSPDELLGQTDLQAAALGWLAQQALFQRLIDRHGPDRVVSLDSESLVARPEDVMARLARHYGLRLGDAEAKAIAEGPVFKRHSKFGGAFDAASRAADQGQSDQLHGDEVDTVVAWAEAVAMSQAIPLRLGTPLLD